jgi:hypothetical protein
MTFRAKTANVARLQILIDQGLFADRSDFLNKAFEDELECYNGHVNEYINSKMENLAIHSEAYESMMSRVKDPSFYKGNPPQRTMPTPVESPQYRLADLLDKALADFKNARWTKDAYNQVGFWPNVWRKEIEEHMPVDDFIALVLERGSDAPIKKVDEKKVVQRDPEEDRRSRIDLRRKRVIQNVFDAMEKKLDIDDWLDQYAKNTANSPMVKKDTAFSPTLDVIKYLLHDLKDNECLEFWKRTLEQDEPLSIVLVGVSPTVIEEPRQVLENIMKLYEIAGGMVKEDAAYLINQARKAEGKQR